MPVTNKFTITYGSRAVGGSSSTYLLHGPYIIDKSYEELRLVFDVVVVASSYTTLQSLSDSLEDDFSKRDQNLVISLDGSSWTYTAGSTILNTRASLTKTGNEETDRGYSRAYTCVIEGGLPADDNGGLRDIEVNVDYEAGRQKIVTMRGVYTAVTGSTASAQYMDDFGYGGSGSPTPESTTILSGIDALATWELVDENYTRDRNDYTCTFTQQYLEVLADQSAGLRDDGDIRDHRVTFTDLSQHPGDTGESIYRLRRVVGSYDCAIDIDQTTNLQTVYEEKVKNHVRDLFVSTFNPQVYGIEDQRVSYDETSKRMSVAIQYIYQSPDGSDVVETSESVAYREQRNIDYTPLHNQGEFSAEVDPGFAVRERIYSRTSIIIGSYQPRSRIGPREGSGGGRTVPLGAWLGPGWGGGGNSVNKTGWNTVSNTSQVTPQWIGQPGEEQIRVTVLSETIVERYNDSAARR